jgi:hypothetical protein
MFGLWCKATLGQGVPLALHSFRASIISLLLRTNVSFVTRQRTNLANGRGIENRIDRTVTDTKL